MDPTNDDQALPGPQGLERYLEQVVGSCTVLRTLSQPGTSEVLEGVDGDGTRWFAKRVDRLGQWAREVRAYRNWVPALGDRAPRLKSADKRLQSLVISAVPGGRGPLFDPELHRTAGQLLSLFHHSQSPRPAPDEFGGRMLDQLDAWLARAGGLFTDAEVGFARSQARGLSEFPNLLHIASHGDYRPNNWLVGDDGIVRVIDFGNSCWHFRAFDLSRLHYGPWWGRPRLAEAFLDGYGHPLTDDDLDFIRLHLATRAVVAAVWGRLHGVPSAEQRGRQRLSQLMAGQWQGA